MMPEIAIEGSLSPGELVIPVRDARGELPILEALEVQPE
ncbi:hypothetical protein SEA_KUWABARA_56 [Gordonia phage Kuwabara]|nr:hypothetical protein SEA_KUWABARA_56 [Gordonia phage Kuwabara]